MLKSMRLASVALCATLLTVFAVGGTAEAGGVRVGALICNIDSGFGFIVGSSRDVDCVLDLANGPKHRYTGKFRKYGLDIGYVSEGRLAWAVIAPSWSVPYGALAGSYVGATAEVSAGFGVGANVLIGGGNKSFALQPLSVQGVKGFNLAAGVGALTLNTVR